jgi:multidrug efflux pump subunit AcrA (membrane-fusion protein)
VAAGIILALIFVTFFKPMYHVSAKFEFVPLTQRTISAPFEGVLEKIADSPGKNRVLMPGDQVKKGQLLLLMDVEELTLQRNASEQEANEKRAEATKARGEGDTATAKADDFAADKAESDAKYYDEQINRGHIVAPIDGTILSGDLEKKVGMMVKQEDELFVIGQPQNLQAKLSVNERDIQDVRDSLSLSKHGTGTLSTDSNPGGSYNFKINRIVPNGHPEDGSSVFDVYADVDKIEPTWQPGMQGEARVNVEDRRLAWIWTHRLVDFLRLHLWM